MTRQSTPLRQVHEHELEIIREASIGFVATRNPFDMVEHISRIAGLGMSEHVASTLGVMRSKLKDPVLHTPIQDMALALGGEVTLQISADALDMQPFVVYEGIIGPVLGSAVLRGARVSFSSKLDYYMGIGDSENAQKLYELGMKAGIAKPLNWAAIRGSYRLARGARRIVGRQ